MWVRYVSIRMMCIAETISITLLIRICHYKRRFGRHKCSSRRSISEAAPCFRNVYVREPSVLRKKQKKPSYSWKKPSDSQCSCATNAFRKMFQMSASFFWTPTVFLPRKAQIVVTLVLQLHVEFPN